MTINVTQLADSSALFEFTPTVSDALGRAIVDDLHQYLEARSRQISAKSKLGEAVRYAITLQDGLSRFLDEGRINLDSDTVECSTRRRHLHIIRRFASFRLCISFHNRKNVLFAGQELGTENWAAITSLVRNCEFYGFQAMSG